MEKATFPLRKVKQTQAMYASFSHSGMKAIDFAGTGENQKLYAPFTGVIKYIGTLANGHGIALESKNKVKYADGTEDYMVVYTGHDNNVSNLYVGKEIKQGDYYSDMGTAGNATGVHTHLEVAKGKWQGLTQLANGNWTIKNSYYPYQALFTSKETVISNTTYQWISIPTSTPVKKTIRFTVYDIDTIGSEEVKVFWKCDSKVKVIEYNNGTGWKALNGYPYATIKGLQAGSEYRLQLRANRYDDESVWGMSDVLTFTTLKPGETRNEDLILNSNGGWIKRSDGVMILWEKREIAKWNIKTPSGNKFTSTEKEMPDYPVSFTNTPTFNFSISTSGNFAPIFATHKIGDMKNMGKITIFSDTSQTYVPVTLSYIAIGKYK